MLDLKVRKRILVVEDEFLVAMAIQGMLEDSGFTVVGPAANVAKALTLLKDERVDGALLDVNLRGDPIMPVVDLLSSRSVPMILATGYGDHDLAEDLRRFPRLRKPFSPSDLRRAAETIFDDSLVPG